MINKKRLKDGKIVSLSNWDVLPNNTLKGFEDIMSAEIPQALKDRLEPVKQVRTRKSK